MDDKTTSTSSGGYLDTADVWTILDLVVAEWQSDPQSCTCFDLRVIERAKVLVTARRRQRDVEKEQESFAVLAQALSDHLEDLGWRAVAVGNASIRGYESPGLSKYEFAVQFTGGRKRQPTIIVPGNGGGH